MLNEDHEQKCRTGMVAIVGPPNAGKSTLMNTLLEQKISIVTPKPQTTRNRILGIMNGPEYQMILLDTPGLHQARQPLNEEMVKIAMSTLTEVDVILFLVDVSLPLPEKQKQAVSYLAGVKRPAILGLNKIDLIPREKVLPLIDLYSAVHPFSAIIPLSALHNSGTDVLVDQMVSMLPPGPRLYPEDIPTDATERFIVGEIIREKIFLLTEQEIPYSTAVTVESFKEDPARGLVTIHANIYVEKDSQKGVIIGRKGEMLTRIGTAARHDMEILLDQRVLLKLWVKVRKNWSRDPRFLKELGF